MRIWQILGALVVLVTGCAPAPGPPPPSELQLDSGAPGQAAEALELASWREILAAEGAVPENQQVGTLALELIELLRSPNPEIRDDIATTLLDNWILRQKTLTGGDLRALLGPLSSALEGGEAASGEATNGEATREEPAHGRSFSALALSMVVRRDTELGFLSPEEISSLVVASGRYAASESDLRGRVEGEGWVHAAAHTADLLAALASHPAVGEEQAKVLLTAVSDLCVRRHGFILHHGEDARLAEPVLRLVKRGFVGTELFESWIDTLLAPLMERGQGGFDAPLYAAQRNARNLLFTLHTRLALVESPSPEQESALAILTAALRG
ncbi:MAG: DUF2785 domain-containing protein [Deltaproteobacteria bacterium]|nr:DUF2785 domain-containing protein [Deltaproteobacteria bacterium]